MEYYWYICKRPALEDYKHWQAASIWVYFATKTTIIWHIFIIYRFLLVPVIKETVILLQSMKLFCVFYTIENGCSWLGRIEVLHCYTVKSLNYGGSITVKCTYKQRSKAFFWVLIETQATKPVQKTVKQNSNLLWWKIEKLVYEKFRTCICGLLQQKLYFFCVILQ